LVHQAEKHLGRHGCALAVLGLVEAFGRIRNPEAYLAALIKRQLTQGLNLVGMFRSSVKPAQTAGLYA
jgi:replication initiation protein RepC